MAFFQKTDDSGALQLAPQDNIAVATRELPAGSTVQVADTPVTLQTRVDIGHKFALRPISRGERIFKYGAPIGRASADIAAGDYVHLHNLQSDYLPSYTLEPIDENGAS